MGYFVGTRADATNPADPLGALAKIRDPSYHATVRPGTRVEVRSRFEAAWTRGFEVVERVTEVPEPRYKVRRRSDGSILPVAFDEHDLREERRRGTWWVQ